MVDQSASAGEWFYHYCGVEGGCLVRSDPDSGTLSDDWRESRVNFQSEMFKGEESEKRDIPLDDGGEGKEWSKWSEWESGVSGRVE